MLFFDIWGSELGHEVDTIQFKTWELHSMQCNHQADVKKAGYKVLLHVADCKDYCNSCACLFGN